MFEEVNHILNEQVKPQLKSHSGDIKLLSVQNGIVEVKFIGACSNCPSQFHTLQDMVESTVKKHIPEVKKVISVNETSEELIDFAKKLLNQNKR